MVLNALRLMEAAAHIAQLYVKILNLQEAFAEIQLLKLRKSAMEIPNLAQLILILEHRHAMLIVWDGMPAQQLSIVAMEALMAVNIVMMETLQGMMDALQHARLKNFGLATENQAYAALM